MLSIKFSILYVVLLTTIAEIQSLVEVSTAEDGILRFAGTIIRKTMNHIFADLNIRDVNWQPKLKQFFTIHNYFMSITLTDCDNLNKIVELSRVYNIDNNTRYLIAKINEVLDKSEKSNESNTNNEYVEKYIEIFISKLKHLKDKYVSKSKDVKVERKVNYLNSNNTTQETRYKRKETKVEKILYDDDEFWKPSGRRLFRGFRTSIKHFPFMASIQFFRKFQCAGSIIKSDLVITSASCLQLSWNNRFFRENPSFVTVQIGSDYYEHGGENIGVQEIYFYPTYDPKTLNNNLAIIRLSRRINFRKRSRRVRKIDIDRNPSKWIPNKRFDLVTVIGWGARDSSNIIYNVLNNKLSYAELDYYPLSECRKHYSRNYVTKRNFCAGFFSKGGGACNRDAGGPAVVNGILLGVISFGSPICGSPDSPTVFTKVGFYADWIDEILEKEVPYTFKRTTTALVPRPLAVVEKSTSKQIVMTPMVATTDLRVIDDVEALRIPQQDVYDDFLSFSLESQESFEKIKTKLKEKTQQPLKINKKSEDISTHSVKVTANIPVIGTFKRTTTALVPKPFVVVEKSTIKQIMMTPMVTTKELKVIDDVEALTIPQQDGYDEFLPFSLDSKESFEKIKSESKETTRHPLKINKKLEDISTQSVKVTANIPVIESIRIGETDSELDELEENESNDAPIETGTESAAGITVLGKLEEYQDVKNNVNILVDNLNINKLLNEMENNKTKIVNTEKSKFFSNDIKQSSSVDYLSSSSEDEEGLNIPAESLSHDVPLKKIPITRDYDKVSETLLFEVVSKAIEEEIKLQMRERKNNLKEHSI